MCRTAGAPLGHLSGDFRTSMDDISFSSPLLPGGLGRPGEKPSSSSPHAESPVLMIFSHSCVQEGLRLMFGLSSQRWLGLPTCPIVKPLPQGPQEASAAWPSVSMSTQGSREPYVLAFHSLIHSPTLSFIKCFLSPFFWPWGCSSD